jgi:translation initiation factor IF-3
MEGTTLHAILAPSRKAEAAPKKPAAPAPPKPNEGSAGQAAPPQA